MPWWKNKFRPTTTKLALLCYLVAGGQAPTCVFSQSSSLLSEGDWYKIGITADGVYRLDAAYLTATGINPDQVQPGQIALFGNGRGILPQPNSAPRPDDLRENAIWVDMDRNGRLEAIYFYGEGPTDVRYDSASGRYLHEVNPYTDTTFYFLHIRNTPGLRVQTYNPTPPASPSVSNTFEHYWFYERESVNLLKSGREWWGDYLGTTSSRNFEVEVPGMVPAAKGYLDFSAIAAAQVPTRFIWQVEEEVIGEQAAGTVSTYRYDLKAQKAFARFDFTTPPGSPEKLKMNILYDKNGQPGAAAYLDYVSLQVKRRLAQYDTPTIYRIPSETARDRVFEFDHVSEDFLLWDITDPLLPVNVNLQNTGNGKFWLVPPGTSPGTYIGFTREQAIQPPPLRKIANQDIRSAAVPDMIIVTAEAWRDEALRLAAFRESNDGLTVLTVTIEQVFNEFSSGKQDVTAIRDLCRYFYLREKDRLKYLLLFGDAAYDFRNKGDAYSMLQQASWIPSYQSRESLHPVYTFSSDDYFGFLDDSSGAWEENSQGDHRLQIGVGRLPVKSRQDATLMVDKLIDYASGSAMGKWRNRIAFIADNGDNNIHQQHADLLARQVSGSFSASRIFIDEYPLTSTPLGNRAPAVNEEIKRRINEGSLIVNFTGHGDESGWTDEQILTLADMQVMRGYRNMPLLVTATCEFGRYDDPAVVSGAELMLLSPRGAAIGAMTTTRPVFASTNFTINNAFYEALSSGAGRLGDIIRETKNNSLAGALNRNFVLLGDPSMALATPEMGIRWVAAPDTLKPFEKATLKGEIFDPMTAATAGDFNGIVYISVFDKPTRFETIGALSPPAGYEEHRTKLFEGTATVSEGRFEFSFIVPDQGFTELREGLTTLYAHTDDELMDASGHLTTVLGPPTSEPAADHIPPVVNAYLNDPSFIDGQTIAPSPVLVVHITDDGGLQLSDETGDCGIAVILDDTVALPVMDYYAAARNSYSEATVVMPLNQVIGGEHTLWLRFCDISGNKTEKTIRFKIGQAPSVTISSAVLFPNPFRDKISYRIDHNKPGSDLEVELRVFSLTGRPVYDHRRIFYNAEAILESELPSLFFTGEIKPEPQVYLYELTLRSLQDKSTQRKTGKLLHR